MQKRLKGTAIRITNSIISGEVKDRPKIGSKEATSKPFNGVVTAYFLFAKSILSNVNHNPIMLYVEYLSVVPRSQLIANWLAYCPTKMSLLISLYNFTIDCSKAGGCLQATADFLLILYSMIVNLSSQDLSVKSRLGKRAMIKQKSPSNC